MQKVTTFLFGLGARWQSWAAVVAICGALLAAAVYYQEKLFHYPCELCIYTRVWMVFIALFAIDGLFLRKTQWPLRIILLIEILLTLGLMNETWNLLKIEYSWGDAGACSAIANFPSWARLDEWIPVLFKVQGSCMPTPYVVGKISMAHGLAGVSIGFLVAFVTALIGSFKSIPKK